jgi:hypothetical protein
MEMDPLAVLAIQVVALLVVAAGAYSFISGPKSPLARNWRRRLNELEVTARMGSPEEIIEALRESAKLYVRLGKRWEAETVMRRAVLISKQQFGDQNAGLVPILEDFARVMDSMHRKKEAEQMRKEMQRIKQKTKK